MISLVLAMLRARRGQAVALALLAMFAVASAVAAPAYLQAVAEAVVAGQVATATPGERGLTVTSTVGTLDGTAQPDFANAGAGLVTMPGFTQIHAVEYATIGIEPDPKHSSQVVYRQDACAHLRIVDGRCAYGEGEVVLGEQTARRLKLAPGDAIGLSFATFSDDPRTPMFFAAGAVKRLTVVGTYTVTAPDDPYWGVHGYFAAADGRPGEPVFTNVATVTAMDHKVVLVSIDATADPGTFDLGHLAALRNQLNDVNTRTADLGQGANVTTAIPQLLSRIDRGRALARQMVPVAAVPLVMLACFVIFLAVRYGTEGRGPELAVVALRGARNWVRWWLATGESMFAIVVGALAGCLVGQLLVDAVVAWRFPHIRATAFSLGSLRYAPAAAAGAVLAALLAQRRQLASSVVNLLQRRLAPAHGWRLVAGEAVVVLLAAVTAAQLWVSGGELTGIGMFAPALVILTVALAAARALLPLISWYGTRALRRGRLGAALAGFQLARRPGAQRMFLLLVVSVAMLDFAACAVDVAGQDRAIGARVGAGAPRVLSVAAVTRQQLLAAVRATDPKGDYAMAVAELPAGAPGELPKLAVDSSRLSAVAGWRGEFGALSADEIARRLKPSVPPPVMVAGPDVTVDLTVTGADLAKPVSLGVVLAGKGTVTAQFGALSNGPYTFQLRVPQCVDGCRFVGFHLSNDSHATGISLSITLRGLRTVNPERTSASATELADVGRWRIVGAGTLAAAPDGLRIDLDAPSGIPAGVWVQPVEASRPLPVVSTAALPPGGTLAGLDGIPTLVSQVARVSTLPRLGADGTLVDLEYADRLSTDAGPATHPEVWLSASAPPDVLARLADNGLLVTGDRRTATVHQQLDQQGPALALWFYLLAGALAVVLATGGLVLAGAVDRRGRIDDLAVLRTQGVDRRTVGRAVLWDYPVLVLLAALVGLAAALVGWRLTGWALPVFDDHHVSLLLPVWPRPLALLAPWLAATVLLVGAALAVGNDLRYRVRR